MGCTFRACRPSFATALSRLLRMRSKDQVPHARRDGALYEVEALAVLPPA
jgi:hypothetical protein